MKKKILAFALALSMLAIIPAGCGRTDRESGGSQENAGNTDTQKPAETGTVKVTLNEVAHSIFYAPMYAAIEEGYFEEEGIDISLVTGFSVI